MTVHQINRLFTSEENETDESKKEESDMIALTLLNNICQFEITEGDDAHLQDQLEARSLKP